MNKNLKNYQINLNWEQYEIAQKIMVNLYGLLVFNLPILSIPAWFGQELNIAWYWYILVGLIMSFFAQKLAEIWFKYRSKIAENSNDEFSKMELKYNSIYWKGSIQTVFLLILRNIFDLLIILFIK